MSSKTIKKLGRKVEFFLFFEILKRDEVVSSQELFCENIVCLLLCVLNLSEDQSNIFRNIKSFFLRFLKTLTF